MSAITTHVLDVANGRPASGIDVVLERRDGAGGWQSLCRATTDADGRASTLLPERDRLVPGTYRLIFNTQRYFEALSVDTLYPEVTIVFRAAAGQTHYHVPLLLSPFGYTTYRGT